MKNKSILRAGSILLLCLLCLACGNGSSSRRSDKVRGASTSAPYELLVVARKDWLKTPAGEALQSITEAKIPCLPQAESWFRTTNINPADFRKSFRLYANIITAEVSSRFAEPKCRVTRDVYARPQIVVTLTAPNETSFIALCDQYRDRILDLFNQAENEREIRVLSRKYSGIVQKQAMGQFGCDIHAPEDINAIKLGQDFFWASDEGNHENYLNLCLYRYPYVSPTTFTLDYFLAKRDSFMRENIQGETEGSYMSSDHRVMQTRNIEVNGHFVQEVRGLWQMEHEAMGGPFISYSQVDTVHNQVIVAEGFVFAPGKDKRPFIRVLEAALQTLRLPAAEKSEEL